MKGLPPLNLEIDLFFRLFIPIFTINIAIEEQNWLFFITSLRILYFFVEACKERMTYIPSTSRSNSSKPS